MDIIKWAFKWSGSHKRRLYICFGMSLLFTGLIMIEPFIFSRIIDDVLLPGKYDGLLPLLLTALSIGVTCMVAKYIGMISQEYLSQEIVRGMRRDLFSRLLDQSPRFFRRNRGGDLITKCTGDVDTIRHFFCWVVPGIFECILMIAFVLTIFFMIGPSDSSTILPVKLPSSIVIVGMSRAPR